MTITEFSNQFDVLYNNITSNQAPGLNEYEKSVFLTKAQNEIVKNYFTANSKGNNIGQGFDDSAKRQADFSCLMKTKICNTSGASSGTVITNKKYICIINDEIQEVSDLVFIGAGEVFDIPYGTYNVTYIRGVPSVVVGGNTYQVENLPSGTCTEIQVIITTISVNQIDSRSSLYLLPDDIFIIINEVLTTNEGIRQVVPLRYDEYLRLMSKPFKRPLKNQAWRLINSGSGNTKIVEIIVAYQETISSYNLRYIRTPKPIILIDLDDGLSIGGLSLKTPCELDPIIHEDILQRAVELAKVAWTATGQDNAQMVLQAGQRSE